MKRLVAAAQLAALPALAQCVMCFRTAEAQQHARAEVLNMGILLLGTAVSHSRRVLLPVLQEEPCDPFRQRSKLRGRERLTCGASVSTLSQSASHRITQSL